MMACLFLRVTEAANLDRGERFDNLWHMLPTIYPAVLIATNFSGIVMVCTGGGWGGVYSNQPIPKAQLWLWLSYLASLGS